MSVGKRELVVCAPLRWEARALRTGLPAHSVVRTGFGVRRSARSAVRLEHGEFASLAVAGLGGGLDPALRSGDVVVATELRGPSTAIQLPTAAVLVARMRAEGLTVHTGPVVTTDHIVHGSERTVLARSGALVADMESAALAVAAGTRPLAVVRVVLDTPHEPLLNPTTAIRARRALRQLGETGRSLKQWASAVAHQSPQSRPSNSHRPHSREEVS